MLHDPPFARARSALYNRRDFIPRFLPVADRRPLWESASIAALYASSYSSPTETLNLLSAHDPGLNLLLIFFGVLDCVILLEAGR
ncbi:hypothetical protein AXF42_Ash010396 [Apostasia shenzhenica]|uniref:Uncharacterized protein n=1 Tax=Apostasia shenzhenica TaxID=1088818 RepID=A0A2I0BDV8_9ASPA|nr:hypothetical protein AXF42_Ash010396 [Apostasia shenzhenica]